MSSQHEIINRLLRNYTEIIEHQQIKPVNDGYPEILLVFS